MCIIAVALDPGRSLLVAANRDELRARPFLPPRLIADGIAAGVDGVAGGTWMGATRAGFFAGLTNRRTPGGAADRRLRSRGAIVTAVLRAGTVEAAGDLLAGLDPHEYNPFHLMFGDARRLRVAAAPPGATAITFEEVGPGVHVLPNGPLDDPSVPKVARMRALLGDGLDVLARHAALADHSLAAIDPLASICVHTLAYGTTSSTILDLAPGRVGRYLFAPGPPCVTTLDDHTALLA